MKIEITYQWWRWPYCYRALVLDLYKRHSTSRYGDQPDGAWWEMPTHIASWLRDLPKRKTLGVKVPAVKFTFRTPRERGFRMVAHAGRLQIGSDPPVMGFVKKSDILMMKLTWGGNV